MIYLFHGEDDFSSFEAAHKQSESLVSDGLELEVIDADDTSVDQFHRMVGATTLFGANKVVLAKRLLTSSKYADYILDNLDLLIDKPIVIWHQGKVDGRLAVLKHLKQKAKVVEFEGQKDRDIESWVTARAKEMGLKLDYGVASLLVLITAGEKGVLASELEKLSLYDESPVTEDVVRLTSGLEQSGDIWKFLDSLANGNQANAIKEFDRLIRFGQNEQYILAMLNRELWLIAKVKDAEESGRPVHQLGMAPFVLQKVQQKARRFSMVQIKKLAFGLMRLDLAIKQGRVDPTDGLLAYLLSW